MRPFRPASLWNTKLTSKSVLGTATPYSAMTNCWLDTWNVVSGTDWGQWWTCPVYYAKYTDTQAPLYWLNYATSYTNINNSTWKRSGNSNTIETAIRAACTTTFPTKGGGMSTINTGTGPNTVILPTYYNQSNLTPGSQFYFPSGITPTKDTDGHVCVVQPDGFTVLEMYSTFVLTTLTPSLQFACAEYGVTCFNGDGDGWENGNTAPMVPSFAGIITDQDIQEGEINHAIAIQVPGGLLKTGTTAPAIAWDTSWYNNVPPYATDGSGYTMGQRFAIPQTTDLTTLGLVTNEAFIVGRALQRYGAITTDRGGSGLTFRAQPITPTGVNRSSWLQVKTTNSGNDLTTLGRLLRPVTSL